MLSNTGISFSINSIDTCDSEGQNIIHCILPQAVKVKQGTRLQLVSASVDGILKHIFCANDHLSLLGATGEDVITKIHLGPLRANSEAELLDNINEKTAGVATLIYNGQISALTIKVSNKDAKWISLSPQVATVLGLRQMTAIGKDGSVTGGLVKLDRIISSLALTCEQVESSFITPTGAFPLLGLLSCTTRADNPRIVEGVAIRQAGHDARIASNASETLTHLNFSLASLQAGQLTKPCLSHLSVNLCLSFHHQ